MKRPSGKEAFVADMAESYLYIDIDRYCVCTDSPPRHGFHQHGQSSTDDWSNATLRSRTVQISAHKIVDEKADEPKEVVRLGGVHTLTQYHNHSGRLPFCGGSSSV